MLLECRRGRSQDKLVIVVCGNQELLQAHHQNIIESTYLLKLELIHDDEAVSISRPLNGSTVILAFSVEHYSELILCDNEAKKGVRVD